MGYAKGNSYYSNARIDLLALLPEVKGRFLEIGCGAGATLACLKDRGAAYVAGVDINPDAVALAAGRGVDLALAADVSRDELPFAEKEFDCIILADVLEHLYDPLAALVKVRRYLKDDGCLLLSVPNIRHYAVLLKLIFRDEWTYTEDGVLDDTHVRFFTLKEIERLLARAGFRVAGLGNNSVSGNKLKLLNALLFGLLAPFRVIQYLVLARRA